MRAGAGIVWCGVPGHDAAARGFGHRGHHASRSPPPPTARSTTPRPPPSSRSRRGSAPSWSDRASGATSARSRRGPALVADAPVPLVLDADGLNALDGDLAPLRAARRTDGADAARRGVRAPRRRAPGRDRLGGRRPPRDRERRGGAAEGLGHGRADAGRRRHGSRSTPPAGPGWPPPAPATCSRASSARCWPGAASRSGRGRGRRCVHGRAADRRAYWDDRGRPDRRSRLRSRAASVDPTLPEPDQEA